MTTDPFAMYRVRPEIKEESQEEDPFEMYRPKPQEKEGLLAGTARQGARNLARVGETVLGAPRAFGEFLESIVPEKALMKGAEKIGLEKPAKVLLETTKKYAPYKLFPTSDQVKDLNTHLFGKAVEPQNPFEKKSDEIISDFAALALPIPGKQLKLLKPALLSLGGNIASGIIGKLGGSEKEKTYAKLGTIFVGSLANPGGAKKLGEELYTQARNLRPSNVRVETPKLSTRLNAIERELKMGGTEAWKPKIFAKIDEIRKEISGNNIKVADLEKFKTSVNNITSELYAEKNVGKTGIKSAQRYANQVARSIDQSLGDYGKINPEWEKIYRQANEVYGSIAKSNDARNFIGRVIGKVSPHITATLFGIGHGAPAQTLSGMATGIAAGGAAIESQALLRRIATSPTLRKYYYGVVQNAVKEDAVAVRDNMRKLEEALAKEDQSK